MKILALKWRRLGDTVLWTAALEALKQHFSSESNLEIDLAFPESYAPLFAVDPRVSKKFPLANRKSAVWHTAKQLRERNYDWVLSFHSSGRSLRLSLLSGAKRRVIHHHARHQHGGKNSFFSHRKIPNLGIPMSAIERDLNVVRALGWQESSPAPKIFLDPATKTKGREQLQRAGWNGEELLLFSVSASRPAKQWPLENYVRLARSLAGKPQRLGLVFDSESVFMGDKYFRDQLKDLALWLPTPRLTDLMGVLSHARLYVGSDSGVKHLACALGVSTLTLFGPESLGEWHGYPRDRHPVIQKKVLCRFHDPKPEAFAWCGEASCPLGSHACMSLITPAEVAEAAQRILELHG